MSLVERQRDGYYDENGDWQRTKFCLVQCSDCTCREPWSPRLPPAFTLMKIEPSEEARLAADSEVPCPECGTSMTVGDNEAGGICGNCYWKAIDATLAEQ